ncbi:MAG: YgiT-type zinc finger protein [Myxococcales bacterium]
MKCPQCGARMQARTESRKYDPGIEGARITLLDVEVHRCPKCGEEAIGIRNMVGLHRRIAQELVAKAARLSPAEVRFLRLHLGLTVTDSRCEDGRHTLGCVALGEHDQAVGHERDHREAAEVDGRGRGRSSIRDVAFAGAGDRRGDSSTDAPQSNAERLAGRSLTWPRRRGGRNGMEWVLGRQGGPEISVTDEWLIIAGRAVAGTQHRSAISSVDPYGDAVLDPARVAALRDAVRAVVESMMRPPGEHLAHRKTAVAVLAFLDQAVSSKLPLILVGD